MSDPSPADQDLSIIEPTGSVSLSPWVNERFPGWDQILSAHQVARLTRRPQSVLSSMALLGRFPKKHRYHGRKIGWLRSEIVDWLAMGPSTGRREGSSEALVRQPAASTLPRRKCLKAQALLRPGKTLCTLPSAEHQDRLGLGIPCGKRTLRRRVRPRTGRGVST
jgi:predicted DNA-binding transcriptional regulator AlpA